MNKVNSKITLNFDVAHSQILTDEEKHIILTRLSGQLTKDGVLQLSSQDQRSQLENKEDMTSKRRIKKQKGDFTSTETRKTVFHKHETSH